MTLVICPQCRRHVEDNVTRCPHCGRTKPFPYRPVIFAGILLVILIVAMLSGTIAKYTMPVRLRAGTAKACVRAMMPTLLAEALPGSDWSSVGGQCTPTWYKAIKYGFPSSDGDTLSNQD